MYGCFGSLVEARCGPPCSTTWPRYITIDPVRDVADDVQVVRDEDVGEAEVALQVLEQVEDLRLHRDVERRDGLVADDQLRVQRRARGRRRCAAAGRPRTRAGSGCSARGSGRRRCEQLLHAPLDLRLGAELVHLRRASATMKPTRLRGFSDAYGSWKIIIISRRNGRISARESRVMSWPRNVIVPAGRLEQLAGCSRAIVDLPHPDSPTTPSVSPSPHRERDARRPPSPTRSPSGT